MDLKEFFESATVLAAAVGAGLLAAVQRVVKSVGATRLQHAADSAQLSIIDGLRVEMVRMHEQNGKLARLVNDLQLEVIQLREENSELRSTVNDLRDKMQQLSDSPATRSTPL